MLDPISIAGLSPTMSASDASKSSPEEIFARFLLKEVRKAMPDSMGGEAMKNFGDLIDEELAKRIVQSGQLNFSTPPRAPHAARQYQRAAGTSDEHVGEVSSAYGARRDPFTGAHSFHDGLDLAAPEGTPIHSLDAGTVVFAGERGGYGNLVIVEHANGLQTRYAHCSRVGVKVGDEVGAGQIVAAVGSTGRSTGPHVHVEVRRGKAAVNPGEYYDPKKVLNFSGR